MAKSEAEVVHIRELLKALGFSSGRPFAKGQQYGIPIYGREQVARFSALVGKRSAWGAPDRTRHRRHEPGRSSSGPAHEQACLTLSRSQMNPRGCAGRR